MRIAFLIVFLPAFAWSQLPKPEVLVDKNVQRIEAWHHPLPPKFENEESQAQWEKFNNEVDTTAEHTATYTIDSKGRVQEISYESEDAKMLVEYEYNHEGKIFSYNYWKDNDLEVSQMVETNPNGNLEFTGKRNGTLVDYILTAPDSTILRSENHSINASRVYEYYPEANTARFSLFRNGILVSSREEKWKSGINGFDTIVVKFEQSTALMRENNLPRELTEVYISKGNQEFIPLKETYRMQPDLYGSPRKHDFITMHNHFNFDQDSLNFKTEIYTAPSYTWYNERCYYTFNYHFENDK